MGYKSDYSKVIQGCCEVKLPSGKSVFALTKEAEGELRDILTFTEQAFLAPVTLRDTVRRLVLVLLHRVMPY